VRRRAANGFDVCTDTGSKIAATNNSEDCRKRIRIWKLFEKLHANCVLVNNQEEVVAQQDKEQSVKNSFRRVKGRNKMQNSTHKCLQC
jgi:hypothetical protein